MVQGGELSAACQRYIFREGEKAAIEYTHFDQIYQ